jgi:hypothetical protein
MLTDILKPALSITEFCEAVSIGRTRAYFEIKIGRLHVLKVGRRSIITVEEMRAWLQRLAQETQGE